MKILAETGEPKEAPSERSALFTEAEGRGRVITESAYEPVTDATSLAFDSSLETRSTNAVYFTAAANPKSAGENFSSAIVSPSTSTYSLPIDSRTGATTSSGLKITLFSGLQDVSPNAIDNAANEYNIFFITISIRDFEVSDFH